MYTKNTQLLVYTRYVLSPSRGGGVLVRILPQTEPSTGVRGQARHVHFQSFEEVGASGGLVLHLLRRRQDGRGKGLGCLRRGRRTGKPITCLHILRIVKLLLLFSATTSGERGGVHRRGTTAAEPAIASRTPSYSQCPKAPPPSRLAGALPSTRSFGRPRPPMNGRKPLTYPILPGN